MGRYLSTAAVSNTSLKSAKRIFFKANATGTYPQSSMQSWTVPTGVTCATFELWGGGGSGAPNCCCNCYGGSHGSGGSYTIKTITVTPGDVYYMTVGIGGCGTACWYNSNACGCVGGTTYVTGNNLTNLCATGGPGGYWCNSIAYNGCNCASVSYGGDLNIPGRGPLMYGCCWSSCGQTGITGSSPFGGGWIWGSGVGSCSNQLACSSSGLFPGGGSVAKPQLSSWCDCCAGCTGSGADGLVIITI